MSNKRYDATLIDVQDIVGKQFGNLKVLGYLGSTHDIYKSKCPARKRHWYLCYCENCGVCKPVERSPLRQNICHSCGCKNKWTQKPYSKSRIVEILYKQGKLGS